MPEVQRKIALMGFPGVGKSSITQRFVSNTFPESYDTTIEDYYQKEDFSWNGQKFRLEIVDTAGQDQYSLFPRSCTVGVDGYILVCAINSRQSYDVLSVIRDKILDHIGGDRVPLVIVGNKQDLQYRDSEVTHEDMLKIGKELGCPVVETSAAENRKIEEIFSRVLMEVEISRGNIKEKKDSCTVS